LDLLQEEDFRQQLVEDPEFVNLIAAQQYFDWKFKRNPKVTQELLSAPKSETSKK
jgi:hypothetical protein